MDAIPQATNTNRPVSCCKATPQMSTDRKLGHLLAFLNLVTLITTLVTSLSLGWSVRIFNNECPLYANLKLVVPFNTSTIRLDETSSLWPIEQGVCNFCTFSPVFGTILAIIFLWFYVLLSDFQIETVNASTVSPNNRLLFPTMFTNVPMAIVAMVSACMVTDGRSYICHQVTSTIGLECNELGSMEWIYPRDGQDGWRYIRAAQWATWGWLASLLSTIAVGAYRIYKTIPQNDEDDDNDSIRSKSSRSSKLDSLDEEPYDSRLPDDSGQEDDYIDQWFENPTFDTSGDIVNQQQGRVRQRLQKSGHGVDRDISDQCPQVEIHLPIDDMDYADADTSVGQGGREHGYQ